MQRKAYVPGVAVLLAALLAACTGSDDGSSDDDPRPGEVTASATVAQPGRYATLPEPCGSVDTGTLDTLLPGIRQIPGATRREQAYKGEATQTYDTDRMAGCRWKVESPEATHYLFVSFERVVSYDNAVSDDSTAQEVYGGKVEAADLPEPTPSASEEETEETDQETDQGTDEESGEPADSGADAAEPSANPSATASRTASPSGSSPSAGSSSPSPSGTPASLLPRTLDGLGDEAFLDDTLGTSKQRTVTVVFRTSNVIVTVEYEEQPATTTVVPDSEEMQDRARNLADRLAAAFDD